MKRLATVILSLSCMIHADALQLGDAVMTEFSGVKTPDASEQFPQTIKTPKRQYISSYEDELFIDPDGVTLTAKGLDTDKKHLWDASVIPEQVRFALKAKQTGQIFGIALDDAKVPNIYVTATSFYGLHIVRSDLPNELHFQGMEDDEPFITGDVDTRPERLILGSKYAKWMQGLWGKEGDAGTVWKIDGSSGKIIKFASIKLDGVPNSGPALGNIAFDRAHRQFFVSDLDTGMIHRLSMKGKDLGHLDHGLEVRKALGLKPVIHNVLFRTDIHSRNFDVTNAKSWGYAREGRRIYGLSVAYGRLYYAVYNGSEKAGEIWSIGLDKKGDFSKDMRFELAVNDVLHHLPITDMIVSHDGEMLLAQRPLNQGSYTMNAFVQPVKAQTLRYHMKVPYDGKRDRWYPVAQEYHVGFEAPYRQGMGGIALGYGYDGNGTVVAKRCNKSVWMSGELLRKSSETDSLFLEEGTGIQGLPRVLSGIAKPAWQGVFSFMPEHHYQTAGQMGDVEVVSRECVCRCDEKVYVSAVNTVAKDPVGILSSLPSASALPGVSVPTGGFPWLLPTIPFFVNCWTIPSLPFCDKDKPPLDEAPKQCMLVKTSPPGPFLQNDGTWQLPLYGIQSLNGMNIDSMKITPISGVAAISNGSVFSVGSPMPILSGVTPGTDAILNLCGFDSTKVVPDKPYECCNVKVKFKIREWESDDDNQTLEVVR